MKKIYEELEIEIININLEDMFTLDKSLTDDGWVDPNPFE